VKNNGGDDQQRMSSSKVMYFSNLCYGGKHKIACFSQLQYQLSCCYQTVDLVWKRYLLLLKVMEHVCDCCFESLGPCFFPVFLYVVLTSNLYWVVSGLSFYSGCLQIVNVEKLSITSVENGSVLVGK
jgi:hypothetical protein